MCPFYQKECLKSQCRLWTKAEVRNEQPGILRHEEGCAISLLVRIGSRGYIGAGRLAEGAK